MINSSAVVASKALSKHSQWLVLGMLSANILLATREIHFPWGALLLGCTPWEAELELRKQISSSAVLPALESCLPEFASRETLLWTEQICSKLYSQSQYDLFAKLNTGVFGLGLFFWNAEINKSKLCEVIALCLSKLLQLQSQSKLLFAAPLCCVQKASAGPALGGERRVCCLSAVFWDLWPCVELQWSFPSLPR